MRCNHFFACEFLCVGSAVLASFADDHVIMPQTKIIIGGVDWASMQEKLFPESLEALRLYGGVPTEEEQDLQRTVRELDSMLEKMCADKAGDKKARAAKKNVQDKLKVARWKLGAVSTDRAYKNMRDVVLRERRRQMSILGQ